MIEKLIVAVFAAIVVTPITLYLKERHPLLVYELKWRLPLVCLVLLIILGVLLFTGILRINLF